MKHKIRGILQFKDLKTWKSWLHYGMSYVVYLVKLVVFHLNRFRTHTLYSLLRTPKKLRTIALTAILLLIILIPPIYLTLRNANPAAAWWDERYLYRQPVDLSYSVSETLTDFQVKVTVNTSTLISAGKMKTDCADIRFYEENYGERDYWIEDGTCNTTTTDIWIKVGKIEKGGKTLWMYYGNNNAGSGSDIADTMEFGDDFEDGAIHAKWTGDTGDFTESGGVMATTSSDVGLYSVSYTITDGIIEARVRGTDADSARGEIAGRISGGTGTNRGLDAGYRFRQRVNTDDDVDIGETDDSAWASLANGAYAFATNTWYRARFDLVGTGLEGYIDGASQLSTTDATYTSGSVMINTRTSAGFEWDWFFVRQYAATEPSTSLGSEEQGQGPILYLTMDEGTGEMAYNAMGAQIVPKPAAWWKMDEATSGNCSGVSLIDSGQRGADAECWASLPYSVGKVGGALGTSSSYTYTTTNVTSNTDNIALSAWVKWTADTANNQTIMTNRGVMKIYLSDTDSNQIHYVVGGTDIDTGTTLTAGTWHHLVLTRRDGVIYGYKDGVEIYSGDTTDPGSGACTESLCATIGMGSLGTNPFNGYMDNAKIFEVGLTDQQVYAEYTETNGYFMPAPTGGPTWKHYAESPQHEQAILFDASNDAVQIPHSDNLNFGNSGDAYSISLWLKNNGYAAPSNDAIIGKSANSTGLPTPFILLINSNNGITAMAGTAGNLVSIDSTKQGLNDNHWHHVELVRDNNTLSLYIDGVLDKTTTQTIGDGRNSAQITIGTYSEDPNANQRFDGELDNVKIYNYARSPDQIKADYNNPCPGGCSVKLGSQITADGMPTPAGYWKFDDGSGQVAVDSSPNGNDGTLGATSASGSDDPSWTESGRASGALEFDGSQDYTQVANDSSISPTSSFTVEDWIKPDSNLSAYSDYNQGILDKGDYQLFLDKTDGKAKLVLDDAAADAYSALGSGLGSTVFASTVWNGNLYIAGNFTTAGGGAANYIASWDGSSWSALGSGTNGAIYGLSVWNGKLYVTGNFTTAGGGAANYIAEWNGSSWSALGSGLDGTGLALAAWNGNLYVGGGFANAGGGAAANIASWDGSSWSALGSGTNNSVYALTEWRGNLYAGGDFTTAGGGAANYIAEWNGSSWSAVGAGTNGRVRAFAAWKDYLYFAGDFTQVGIFATQRIAYWNGSSFGLYVSGLNNTVTSLVVLGGNLYIGGDFTTAGGGAASKIAKLSNSGWSALGSGFDSTVMTLSVWDGDLYAGGYFSTAGGSGANYAAKYGTASTKSLASSTTSWAANQWYHLVATYDGSTLKLYVNGTLENSASSSITLASQSLALFIGKTYGSQTAGGSGEQFAGIIDEVKIYSTALTQEQIMLNYNNKKPILELSMDEGSGEVAYNSQGSQIAPKPAGWWKMDEATSGNCTGTITDSGSGGNDGNCVSTPTYITGRIGGALDFNGTNYVTTSASPTTAVDNWTLSTWINWDADTASNQFIIDAGSTYYMYLSDSDSNQLHLHVGATDIDTNTTVSASTWTHLVMLRRNGVLYGYKDGAEIYSGDTTTPGAPTCYEGECAYFGSQLDGKLDHVKIWDTALTAAQVYAEYAETNAYFQPSVTGGPAWKNYAESSNHSKTISFDGSDDFLDIGDPVDGRLDFGANDFTVETWAYTGSTGHQVMVNKSDSGANNGFSLRMDTSSAYPEFILDDNTSYKVIAKQTINDSAWHHVAAAREGDYLKIYVDGVLSNQITGVDSVDISGSEHLIIGRRYTTAAGYWNGQLDNVKIYNYARSADEIKVDYNNPCPGGCGLKLGAQVTAEGMPAPYAYWKFDEGAGNQVVKDSSGNGHDAVRGASAGSESSDPTFDTSGKVGSALDFDGGDYVDTNLDTPFDFGTSNFAVSAWVKRDIQAQRYIAGKYDGVPQGWIFEVYEDRVLFDIYTDGSNRVFFSSSKPMGTGWHHLLCQRTSTTNADCYQDGELLPEETRIGSGTASADSASDLFIGNITSSCGNCFDGMIDEVKIFDQALTQEQVMLEYSNKRPIMELKMNENSGEIAYNSQGSVISPNPVGWWKMDEAISGNCTSTVYDYGSSGNNVTCQNTVPYTTGQIGGSLNFNGTDDHAKKTVSDYQITDSAGTVSAWIKVASTISANSTIFSSSDTATDVYYWLFNVQSSGGNLRVQQRNNDTNDQIDASTDITDNTWHHVVVTSDGGSYTIYLDAQEESLTVTAGANNGDWFADTDNRDNIVIGALERTSASGYFNGVIDHVKIWDEELTAEEVYAEYNETNAYMMNMDAASDWVTSPFGRSLEFDGSNDYLIFPNQTSLEPANLTLQAWINIDTAVQSEAYGIILEKANDSHADPYYDYLLRVGFNDDDPFTGPYLFAAFVVGGWSGDDWVGMSNVPTDSWHHVAATFDGSVINLYLDGELKASKSNSGSITYHQNHLRIGTFKNLTSGNFPGEIDEVKIYNYARSAAEIKADYNRGAAKFN